VNKTICQQMQENGVYSAIIINVAVCQTGAF
jgi:hypothetical protein